MHERLSYSLATKKFARPSTLVASSDKYSNGQNAVAFLDLQCTAIAVQILPQTKFNDTEVL